MNSARYSRYIRDHGMLYELFFSYLSPQSNLSVANISDTVEKNTVKKHFTLVDTEGNKITEEEQLGLLLYKGGTVCERNAERYNHDFSFFSADAMCRQLNFTQGLKWTIHERFDIQNNYNINLKSVDCRDNEWENCYYSENTQDCRHSQDVFLSCTSTTFYCDTTIAPFC